jgi:type VI secretion system lysozyme-like protein
MGNSYHQPLMARLKRLDEAQPVERLCSLPDIYEDIQKNVETILNCRMPRFTNYVLPVQSDRLEKSTLNFGILDFCTVTLDDPQSERAYCQSIAHAVESFEPRLGDVQVTLSKSEAQRIVSLDIRARLTVKPFDEVRFQSGFEIDSHRFRTVN